MSSCSGTDVGPTIGAPVGTPADSAVEAPPSTIAPASTTVPVTLPVAAIVPDIAQRNEWGDPLDAAPLLPPEKQQIIDALDPTASCEGGDLPAVVSPGDGQSVLQVVRAEGDCIVIDTTIVLTAELEQRTADALAKPDVVSVGEATRAFVEGSHGMLPSSPDPQLAEQTWWLDDLRVAELDALSVDPATPKVRVAVIDTGIDDTNPDLAGMVVGRVPWALAPDSTGHPHGTHVAGIIAAVAGNGVEGRGVARHVELLDVNMTAAVSVSALIDWSTDHGADVINMSFCEVGPDGELPCRTSPSGATAGAIAYAVHRQVLLVASAGNCGRGAPAANIAMKCDSEENRVTYPAAYPGVLSVGAYGQDGNIADFSTQNHFVDVSAPGVGIVSTAFGATTMPMSGTSQAAPMVAGAAAALLAHRPDLLASRILASLFTTVRDAGGPGWDHVYGNGKIDPFIAAQRLDAAAPPPQVAPSLPPSAFPLTVGSTDANVLTLQQALTTAGYDLGEPDGQYGQQTANAVMSFQADQGMVETGETDEKLLDLAASEAAKAPPCDPTLLAAAQGGLPQYWEWSTEVDCALGWAVRSSYLPDTAAGEHYLFRVRGDRWQVARSSTGRAVTTALAQGTAISESRFADLFGWPGWPGRVSSADGVAQFIWDGAIANSGTLPEAWEYVQMWLDAEGFDAWSTWLYDFDGSGGDGVIEPCIVNPVGYFEGQEWTCRWVGADGTVMVLVVNNQLTRATVQFE